jgi:hypothetical protein
MKKILLVAGPLAFALAGCGGPAEEAGEEADDIMEAEAELAEEMGDEAMEESMEAEAEKLEETADEM